jgi:ketosteroid isomerase-like protein
MTEDDFRTYIAAFNARDFAGFSKYYADDVEFNLGDRKQIIGAQGIVDFYTAVFEHIAARSSPPPRTGPISNCGAR